MGVPVVSPKKYRKLKNKNDESYVVVNIIFILYIFWGTLNFGVIIVI